MWSGEARFRAVLIGGRDRAMAEAIVSVRGEIVAELAWGDALPADADADAILVLDASGEGWDGLPDAVEALADRADVVCCDLAQLDVIGGALLLADAQLLCDPTMADRVAALLIATRQDDPDAPGAVRETDSERLGRLNDELTRLVDLLARLTRSEGRTVGDRSIGFGLPPPDAGATAVDPAEVRRVIRARRIRDKAFESGMFEDPAWDILLDLFAAHLERSEVSVSSLCIAAAVAPTTALRWIGRMTSAGLLVRQHDPFDRRRALMSLSDRSMAAMRNYVAMLRAQGLPFV